MRAYCYRTESFILFLMHWLSHLCINAAILLQLDFYALIALSTGRYDHRLLLMHAILWYSVSSKSLVCHGTAMQRFSNSGWESIFANWHIGR